MATTTEQIVIRGDLVEIEQRTLVRSMPLADLIPLIAVPPPITFPRLPMGARFVRMDPAEGKIALVVEVGPKLQSMRTSRHTTTYRLTMPYQYYAFTASSANFTRDENWRMENWYLFWSKEPVHSPNDPVIPAKLPNIYQDRGAICFGTTQPRSDQSLSERIDQIVNEFSVTTFSGDLGWNRPIAYRSFAHWAAESVTDPLGWRNWEEWNNGQPLSHYLANATTTIRPARLQAEGVIPEIVTGWTFGRAAEWLESLSPSDRYRLLRELSNRRDLTVSVPAFDPDDYPVEGQDIPETSSPEEVDRLEAEGATAVRLNMPDEVGTLPAFDGDILITTVDPMAFRDHPVTDEELLSAIGGEATTTAAPPDPSTVAAAVVERLGTATENGTATVEDIVADAAIPAGGRHTVRRVVRSTVMAPATADPNGPIVRAWDGPAPEEQATPRCACQYAHCSCERVVLAWQDTCAACLNGRHVAA